MGKFVFKRLTNKEADEVRGVDEETGDNTSCVHSSFNQCLDELRYERRELIKNICESADIMHYLFRSALTREEREKRIPKSVRTHIEKWLDTWSPDGAGIPSGLGWVEDPEDDT